MRQMLLYRTLMMVASIVLTTKQQDWTDCWIMRWTLSCWIYVWFNPPRDYFIASRINGSSTWRSNRFFFHFCQSWSPNMSVKGHSVTLLTWLTVYFKLVLFFLPSLLSSVLPEFPAGPTRCCPAQRARTAPPADSKDPFISDSSWLVLKKRSVQFCFTSARGAAVSCTDHQTFRAASSQPHHGSVSAVTHALCRKRCSDPLSTAARLQQSHVGVHVGTDGVHLHMLSLQEALFYFCVKVGGAYF